MRLSQKAYRRSAPSITVGSTARIGPINDADEDTLSRTEDKSVRKLNAVVPFGTNSHCSRHDIDGKTRRCR